MSDRRSGYALKRSRTGDARAAQTRKAIVAAAREEFLHRGYAATRVEDILTRAGVSRPTFYRNFQDKFDVAKACHSQSRGEALEPWGAILSADFRDRAEIVDWLEALLRAISAKRDELAMWLEMSSVEPGYIFRMPRTVPAIIAALAEGIPAFARANAQAPSGDDPASFDDAGPIWIEAYLLLDQLAIHWSTLALGTQPMPKAQSIGYFADRFQRFVERYDTP